MCLNNLPQPKLLVKQKSNINNNKRTTFDSSLNNKTSLLLLAQYLPPT